MCVLHHGVQRACDRGNAGGGCIVGKCRRKAAGIGLANHSAFGVELLGQGRVPGGQRLRYEQSGEAARLRSVGIAGRGEHDGPPALILHPRQLPSRVHEAERAAEAIGHAVRTRTGGAACHRKRVPVAVLNPCEEAISVIRIDKILGSVEEPVGAARGEQLVGISLGAGKAPSALGLRESNGLSAEQADDRLLPVEIQGRLEVVRPVIAERAGDSGGAQKRPVISREVER